MGIPLGNAGGLYCLHFRREVGRPHAIFELRAVAAESDGDGECTVSLSELRPAARRLSTNTRASPGSGVVTALQGTASAVFTSIAQPTTSATVTTRIAVCAAVNYMETYPVPGPCRGPPIGYGPEEVRVEMQQTFAGCTMVMAAFLLVADGALDAPTYADCRKWFHGFLGYPPIGRLPPQSPTFSR